MARKKETEYQHQVRLLNKRIKRLEKKGYVFDEIETPRTTAQVKALRGEELKSRGKYVDEIPFTHPQDSEAPYEYNVIRRVREIIREYEGESWQTPLPSHDGHIYGTANYIVGGLFSFYNELIGQMDDDTMHEYANYLLSVEDELATLATFYNVKYLDEVANHQREILDKLNWGHSVPSDKLENMGNTWSEMQDLAKENYDRYQETKRVLHEAHIEKAKQEHKRKAEAYEKKYGSKNKRKK